MRIARRQPIGGRPRSRAAADLGVAAGARKAKPPTAGTVEALRHRREEATRRNIPTAEYESVLEKEAQDPVRVAYERRAAIFIGPEFGTVSRPGLVAVAREAGDANFDVPIAGAFNFVIFAEPDTTLLPAEGSRVRANEVMKVFRVA